MIDIVTFVLSILFLLRGAGRGFIASLLIPFSIIVATIISILYYQATHALITSLVIGLIGPFIINLLLTSMLHIWANATNTNIKPTFLSRLGGALVTLAWGWVFIAFALILLAVLPAWNKTLNAIHNDVTKSASYFFVKPLGETFFNTSTKNTLSKTPQDPNAAANDLSQDPRFQAILQDPIIQKDITNHDLVDLMKNPKIIDLTNQIMSDPATFKKVMAIYAKEGQTQIGVRIPTTKELTK
jgi:uncharacterized membrane protein required for colicin V production